MAENEGIGLLKGWKRPVSTFDHFSDERFADAVLTDRPVSGADFADGIASVRAMLAIGETAATGKPVNLANVSGAV